MVAFSSGELMLVHAHRFMTGRFYNGKHVYILCDVCQGYKSLYFSTMSRLFRNGALRNVYNDNKWGPCWAITFHISTLWIMNISSQAIPSVFWLYINDYICLPASKLNFWDWQKLPCWTQSSYLLSTMQVLLTPLTNFNNHCRVNHIVHSGQVWSYPKSNISEPKPAKGPQKDRANPDSE